VAAANTAAKPLDDARHVQTALEYRPSAEGAAHNHGRCAHSYGSEGWGFESLRARHVSAVQGHTLGCRTWPRRLSGAVSLTTSHSC